MKVRYQYRSYPTDQQEQSLAQLDFNSRRLKSQPLSSPCLNPGASRSFFGEVQKLVITQAKLSLERFYRAGSRDGNRHDTSTSLSAAL
jgi:putative transposase